MHGLNERMNESNTALARDANMERKQVQNTLKQTEKDNEMNFGMQLQLGISFEPQLQAPRERV